MTLKLVSCHTPLAGVSQRFTDWTTGIAGSSPDAPAIQAVVFRHKSSGTLKPIAGEHSLRTSPRSTEYTARPPKTPHHPPLRLCLSQIQGKKFQNVQNFNTIPRHTLKWEWKEQHTSQWCNSSSISVELSLWNWVVFQQLWTKRSKLSSSKLEGLCSAMRAKTRSQFAEDIGKEYILLARRLTIGRTD